MTTGKTWPIAVLVAAAVGLVLVESPPEPAAAQSQPTPVRVINTGAEPVPTAAIGTTNVAGVVGLDPQASTVRVGNGEQEPVPVRPVGVAAVAGTVRVENTPQNPVWVCSACETNAVQLLASGLRSSAVNNWTIYTVPAGKRLVIEFASAAIVVRRGEEVSARIRTTVNGVLGLHELVLTGAPRGSHLSGSRLVASHPLRAYADPGTDVVVTTERHSPSGFAGHATFTLSGYLIDL
jgi:hypothetical protein